MTPITQHLQLCMERRDDDGMDCGWGSEVMASARWAHFRCFIIILCGSLLVGVGAHTGPWRSFRGSEASRGTYILPAAKFEEGIQILLLPPAGTQIISRESKIDITC